VISGDLLGHLDQVALATERPAVDAHVLAGIELRIHPDRGRDLEAAWFRGAPIAWIAPAGEGGADSRDLRAAWGGGLFALGIEPANCSVLGRAHDRSQGTLPFLEPGEERSTRIAITAEEME
jgi:hypothetical protein